MLAKKYRSEIVAIHNPFEGIYTLEFVSLDRPFKYLPGQFLHVAIDEDYDGTGQWPESRCFSIQSNPDEKTLRVTYAVKGEFTGQMEKQLKVGSEVWLKLPYGDLFQQPHLKDSAVFIAGGTGITPFLSLFTHRSFDEYVNPKIYLGFKNSNFNIYAPELEAIGRVNTSFSQANLKIFYQDVDGIIDIEQIFQENGVRATYIISGPPAMIKAFKGTLIEKGVASNAVLTDDWE